MTVRRSARFYTLGAIEPDRHDVWIACHGYAQLAGKFIRHLAPLEGPTRLIVAPEALNRFYVDPMVGAHGPDAKVGATWMTREDRLREIDDYVAYLDALHATIFDRIDRQATTLRVLGFSQGIATAVRWVVKGSATPDHLILWGGTLPPEIDADAVALFRVPRLSIVLGDRDEQAARSFDADQPRLARLGLRVERIRYDGAHHLDAETLRRLAS